jgi:hypothetical protein
MDGATVHANMGSNDQIIFNNVIFDIQKTSTSHALSEFQVANGILSISNSVILNQMSPLLSAQGGTLEVQNLTTQGSSCVSTDSAKFIYCLLEITGDTTNVKLEDVKVTNAVTQNNIPMIYGKTQNGLLEIVNSQFQSIQAIFAQLQTLNLNIWNSNFTELYQIGLDLNQVITLIDSSHFDSKTLASSLNQRPFIVAQNSDITIKASTFVGSVNQGDGSVKLLLIL